MKPYIRASLNVRELWRMRFFIVLASLMIFWGIAPVARANPITFNPFTWGGYINLRFAVGYLILTMILEGLVALLAVLLWKRSFMFVMWAMLVNLVTFRMVWLVGIFLYLAGSRPPWVFWLSDEVTIPCFFAVVVIEARLVYVLGRHKLPFACTLVLSVAANLVSFMPSLLILHF